MQDALNILQRDYYRPISASQLESKGIAGAIASLRDPYSHYFAPSDYRTFLNQSNPHLSGIGVDVLPDAHGLRVVDVFPNSPAARAGLARGDVIVEVGATSLANRSADFDSALIRGPAGTRVTLTIMRGGHRSTLDVTRANLLNEGHRLPPHVGVGSLLASPFHAFEGFGRGKDARVAFP